MIEQATGVFRCETRVEQMNFVERVVDMDIVITGEGKIPIGVAQVAKK